MPPKRLKPAVVVGIVVGAILLAIGIAATVMVVLRPEDPETRTLLNSLQVWFGSVGILLYAAVLGLLVAVAVYGPEMNRRMKTLTAGVNNATREVAELARKVQSSTSIIDVVKSALNRVPDGIWARAATSVASRLARTAAS